MSEKIPNNLMTIAEIQKHFGVKHAAFYAARTWNRAHWPQPECIHNRQQYYDVNKVEAFFRDNAPHLVKAWAAESSQLDELADMQAYTGDSYAVPDAAE